MKRHYTIAIIAMSVLLFIACTREPLLHLYDEAEINMEFPVVDLDLEVLWDYELVYGVVYDWEAEWYYGWDDTDRQIFGEIGYQLPTVFHLRRYNTGTTPYAPHSTVYQDIINGTYFQRHYNWGFWDFLVWNDIETLDGVQSLNFDEESTLDSVTVFTNPSMQAARYHAPRFTRAFYEPEPLFTGYEQAVDINPSLDGFVYDEARQVYVKKLNMLLHPVTYIYLTQVIIHHNYGRVSAVDGNSNISGFARSTVLNSGRAGDDAIAINTRVRLKNNCDKLGESVDIVGGRFLTFGICGLRPYSITRPEQIVDPNRHYFDVTMQFNNGMDSTFVFDVTSQVRHRYKGGVITVELDMDTIPIPRRSGGSAFDAVIEEPIEETHEFEM